MSSKNNISSTSSPAAAASTASTVSRTRAEMLASLRPWNTQANGPEPTPPANLTQVEANAIRTLVNEGYLFYGQAVRTCPFDDLIAQSNTNYNACEYDPLRPRTLADAKFTSDLVQEIASFKNDLLFNVGDDVIAGTIFALSIHDDESENEYFSRHVAEDTATALKSANDNKNNNNNNNNDDDDDDDDHGRHQHQQQQSKSSVPSKNQLQSHKSPFEDPGSASAPHRLATQTFDITASGRVFTFPITCDEADILAYGGSRSAVGIEGKGDVIDAHVRESWEYPAEKLKLPPWLHHPRRFYPRLENQIRQRLCPSAEEIAIVPYKLVCYCENDHFEQHRDSSNDPRHFGTLVINLPTECDFCDTRPFENPEVYSWGTQDSSASDTAKRTANVSGRDQDQDQDQDQDDDDDNNTNKYGGQETVPRRSQDGALRLFLGRDMDRNARGFVSQPRPESAIQNITDDGNYGRPSDSVSQLVATVLMQNYTQEELEGKHPFASASANRLAERLHRPDGTDMTDAEAIAESHGDERKLPPVALLTHHTTISRKSLLEKYKNDFSRKTHPPIKNFHQLHRQHTPLKFAAWLTDVHHEVRKLRGDGAHRIVMTYKLLKSKHTSPLQIPRAIILTSQIERIGELFRKFLASEATNWNRFPRTLGFLLRHAYPVSALEDPTSCLKNVDAVLYHIVSSRYECVLAPVFLVKDNDVGVPFVDDDASKRNCFLTSTIPDGHTKVDLGSASNHEVMHKWFPLISGVEWEELGFGAAFARGSCLGNADCGARWVYRQSALVCLLDKPSTWLRRRIVFLIQEKGFEGNMIQKISTLYPVFRNVVRFL